ncbi:CDC48 family AAA ATPase [Candidatus Pacearchaeota archaeon]|nr:hypothetical protein [uncultured archaeon]MBS3084529.1 CDC48 family AAA ATPase [Candidatus Pacearchaeota archaeon]
MTPKKPKEERKSEFYLKIVESLQEDIDKGIARISSKDMKVMNLVSGDTILIKGKIPVVLKVLRSLGGEKSIGKIRLDGTVRSNIGSSIGEDVNIEKISVSSAVSVTLSPAQEGIRFSDNPTEFFHNKLLEKPLVLGQKIVIDVFGTRLSYAISKVSPKGNVIVTPSTKLIVSDEVYTGDVRATGISYEDIGGLKEEIDSIREMVELPMKHPEVFQKLGVGAPKGVLLTGPPGTGKTLLAKAVATETDSAFFSIAGPEIMSKYYGESEKQIREIFEKAQKNSPSIIFIDEIDSIAPKRGEGMDQTEKRIVAQLLTLMDGLKSRGQLVVMAATNRPEDIDEALRRPGRFDRELRINPPTEEGRKEILQIHTRGMPLDRDVDFNEIARITMGFTGADLEVLSKEAGLKSIKPFFNDLKTMQEKIPTEILDKIRVSRKDFLEALKKVEPSAMREVLIKKPHVTWNDIGGLKEAKDKLRELVELPLMKPELYKAVGIKASKGILLYGPSGTGKTLLAKAVANESNANFISVKGPELISKWVGESEKHVREIFKKAKQVAPCIIFFDEFDSISKSRGSGFGNDSSEKVVNQLLTELDGVEELEGVIVIAATNRRDLIDPALIRSGRIDTQVELPMPDTETREEIFKVHMKNMPFEKDVEIKRMAKKTEGWTGADIEAVIKFAGINSIKRNYNLKDLKELSVTKDDFNLAFKEIKKEKDPLENGVDEPDNDKIKKPDKKAISEEAVIEKLEKFGGKKSSKKK